MRKIKLTLDAERDLIDIYLFGIEHFGHAQAERYAETINAKITAAADNPSIGADYNFVRNGLRSYECVSHAIYYKPTVIRNSCAAHFAWSNGPRTTFDLILAIHSQF
ncbi:type II toxin-antitoxin system RelE/ParE family toxin [Yoonia sp.]|uniref:type II toxin-antitoxin system RelE/ParE family toxin n=1 Tax=Yoonia sp. TaxID=2212373 RepID=UPI002DFA0182|nr:type II toxin-antitoxin system RelE/ParE family toxin [Yoonia sp.]